MLAMIGRPIRGRPLPADVAITLRNLRFLRSSSELRSSTCGRTGWVRHFSVCGGFSLGRRDHRLRTANYRQTDGAQFLLPYA
jgi:hypothetical protein